MYIKKPHLTIYKYVFFVRFLIFNSCKSPVCTLRKKTLIELFVYDLYFRCIAGKSDLIRCFQCGIGLKDFTVADSPLVEHINNAKSCPYLEAMFGPEGVQSRQVNYHASRVELETLYLLDHFMFYMYKLFPESTLLGIYIFVMVQLPDSFVKTFIIFL